MPKEYCVTMELTERTAIRYDAPDHDAAASMAEDIKNHCAERPGLFRGGDLELSYAVDETGQSDAILPWTRPMALEWPEENETRLEDPIPGTDFFGDYRLTVERTRLMAEWYTAENKDEALEQAEKIAERYGADPSLFDQADSGYDYALTDGEGRAVIDWS